MFLLLVVILVLFVFFFKQKTAYEMRINDWSSDVCSSDLDAHPCAQCLAQHEGGSPKPIVSRVRQPAFPCARWMLAIPSGGLKRVYGYDTAIIYNNV